MLFSATMCSCGLLFAVVFLAGMWRVDGSRNGCPDIVQRSRHFAKVHNGTCYLFVDKENYWEQARDSCLKMGGEMLSVENHRTMDFIRSVLNSRQLGWNKRGVWLGARYSDGRWQWTSGKRVGYANWASGEPSKILGFFSVEDCALMRRSDNWRWHDYICGRMKYHFNYICQFPVENIITTTTPTTTSSTTTTTITSSTTTVAAVFKPGHFSKKGHFMDRTKGRLDSHESFQQDSPMGDESSALDHAQNGVVPSHPYNVQGTEPGYPYERHPAFNDRGYNEVHSTTQFLDNGNLTILTIILVTGGIMLMILLMVFLIIRKRYNYKKAVAQPTVHFENRNYNHAHGGSAHDGPLPPPPAPHTFHCPSAPPVPPRPDLCSHLTPHPASAIRLSPHLGTSHVPASRPASDLYLTPIEIGGGVYEEIRFPKNTGARSLTNTPGGSTDMLGACGGMYPLEREDSATIPLISASNCPWSLSEESLHSMSDSLTMKTTSIHNDYVDMNGSPVVQPRTCQNVEAPTTADQGKASDLKASDPKVKESDHKAVESDPTAETSDPKDELSNVNVGDRAVFEGEGKPAFNPNYSNLMTTSQERCENLYAQLH